MDQRQAYAQFCIREPRRLERSRREVERLISAYKVELTKLLREHQVFEEAEILPPVVPDRNEEYEQLLKHPDIHKIEVGEVLTVHTNPILLPHRGDFYEMGRFRIVINPIVSSVNFFSNREPTPEGMIHPHIGLYGSVCFGNIERAIPELIAAHKYPALISLCIQFLKTCNSGYESILKNFPKHRQARIEEERGGKI